MYYEETIIDGVLHVRGTPKGEWHKLTAEEITLKYMAVKHNAAQQSGQADEAYCTDNCVNDPNKVGWLFCPYCGKRLPR